MDRTKAAEIMEENMKTVFAYALSRVSVKEDAEDLAGEIIVNFLASAEKLRDDRAVFGYIWTVAQNTAARFLRKRSAERARRADGFSDDGEESDFYENLADPESEDFTRLIIKKEAKLEIRDKLDYINISERMIYPGLDGICKWIARRYAPLGPIYNAPKED